MTIFRHELRQGRLSLIIWTASIAFLFAVCIFLFPEMKGEMDQVSDVFSAMGNFSAAFGTLTGFYAIECGNILGLGGALYAAMCGISMLSKEEKGHTAEFLLSHPVSRNSILSGKLAALFLQILVLNTAVLIISLISIYAVGEDIPWKEILLLHLAYVLLQIEIASICFGISAFLRQGSLGVGLGLSIMLYFFNIIANISDSAEFLRFISPYGYAEGTEIVTNISLDGMLVLLGMLYGVIGVCAGYIQYNRKDVM